MQDRRARVKRATIFVSPGCDVAPGRAKTIVVTSPPTIVGVEVWSSFATGCQLFPVVVIFPRSRASVLWTAMVLPVQGSGCLVQSKSHRCRSVPDTGSWTCPRVILLCSTQNWRFWQRCAVRSGSEETAPAPAPFLHCQTGQRSVARTASFAWSKVI